MQLENAGRKEMTLAEAQRLLDLSSQAPWSYPTSMGRPVRWERPGEWVETLSRERDSFMQAVAFLMQNDHEDIALEIAAHAWRLWVLARDDEGGRRFLARVLQDGSGKPTRARALALYGDSLLAYRQGKTDESRKRSQKALEVAQSVKDPEALVLANLALSRVAFEDGNYEQARSRAGEARLLARDLDPAFGQAPLFMEAQSYRMLGDYDKAASLFSESVDLNKRIGDRGMVIAELNNLGLVEIHRNNVDTAERLFDESERVSGSKDDDPYGRGMTHLNQAMLTFRRGDIHRAHSQLSKSKSTFAQAGIEPAKDDQFEIDWLDQQLTEAAGER